MPNFFYQRFNLLKSIIFQHIINITNRTPLVVNR